MSRGRDADAGGRWRGQGMRRRLFTVLSALSLLLCVATAVLWVRSCRVADVIARKATHPDRKGYSEIEASWLPGFVRFSFEEARFDGAISATFPEPGWRYERGRIGVRSRSTASAFDPLSS